MIDPVIKERCNRLVEVKFAERRKQIQNEIAQINETAASRNMYGSSIRLVQIHKLLSRELEIRAILTWESLVRVHRLLGSPTTETICEDFKEEISSYIHQAHDELSEKLRAIMKDAPVNVKLDLDEAKLQSIAKHDIEIDLYIDSISMPPEIPASAQFISQQYNLYGNIGAVQTGASAAANVVQNISQEDKNALLASLALVQEQLTSIQEIAENKRHELIEIVNECIQNANSQNPNNTKLLTMLNILGITVQSYASAQPAYQALKSALIPLGISLP